MSKKSAELFRKKTPIHIDRLVVKGMLGRQDLTVADLARKLGISVQYMHDILRGHRNPRLYVARIADALGVSTSAIVEKPVKKKASQPDQQAA